ncbi:tetratricopeptide repeat protein [Candidatus Peregrinibacteria bacterium]|nr:tetratricopeptide repeat protein [Candidatus Peregrinibacteria bacterium]
MEKNPHCDQNENPPRQAEAAKPEELQALEEEINPVSLKFKAGVRLMREKRFEEALTLFENLLEENPDNPAFLENAARCANKLGSEYLERGRKASDASENAFVAENALSEKENHVREAIRCFTRMLQYNAKIALYVQRWKSVEKFEVKGHFKKMIDIIDEIRGRIEKPAIQEYLKGMRNFPAEKRFEISDLFEAIGKQLSGIFPERKTSFWEMVTVTRKEMLAHIIRSKDGMPAREHPNEREMIGLGSSRYLEKEVRYPEEEEIEERKSIDPAIEVELSKTALDYFLFSIRLSPDKARHYLELFAFLKKIHFRNVSALENRYATSVKAMENMDETAKRKAFIDLGEEILNDVRAYISLRKSLLPEEEKTKTESVPEKRRPKLIFGPQVFFDPITNQHSTLLSIGITW